MGDESRYGDGRAGPLWSHRAGWDDLLSPVQATDPAGLDLGDGWPDRWLVTRRLDGEPTSCPVRELVRAPGRDGGPVRWFTWRRAQRHRPGLQFMVSTGRHHGFESLEEARVLLARDFAGDVTDVVSQPLKLRFGTLGRGQGAHARLHGRDPGGHLADRRAARAADRRDGQAVVRRGRRARGGVRMAVRGSGKMAEACAVRAGHAVIAAQAVVGPAEAAPWPARRGRPAGAVFGEVAAASGCEPLARAQLLHLLWHRRLGTDLGLPLADRSPLVPGMSA